MACASFESEWRRRSSCVAEFGLQWCSVLSCLSAAACLLQVDGGQRNGRELRSSADGASMAERPPLPEPLAIRIQMRPAIPRKQLAAGTLLDVVSERAAVE